MRGGRRRSNVLPKPRLLALALALAVAALAVFAAEARAGSFDHHPPAAVLMKYKSILQVVGPAGGQWTFCDKNGACGTAIYDNFGDFFFPKVDEVGAGRRAV
jgi:hypothetical protein